MKHSPVASCVSSARGGLALLRFLLEERGDCFLRVASYLNEFQFRWNTRKMDDGQRVTRAIKQIDGKRLEYRASVENPPYLPKPTAHMEAPF